MFLRVSRRVFSFKSVRAGEASLQRHFATLSVSRLVHRSCSVRQRAPEWGSKKFRERKLRYIRSNPDVDPISEGILAPLRLSVAEQGKLVKKLKESGAAESDIKREVEELKARKQILEDKELSLCPADALFDRTRMQDLLKRRFFYGQSYAAYGGISGLFDLGPMGCAIENNLLQIWRRHFVREESMLEVKCSILTPEAVLRASGHVDRFADFMVKDVKTGECFRLDHLIKAHLENVISDKKTAPESRAECEKLVIQLENMSGEEMKDVLRRLNIKSPVSGNDLSDPIEFNLMFGTQIGASGQIKGYLRPETAQGIFVNFKELLDFNEGKLPFAAAQVGPAFRNEILPRLGLIRAREFLMAEIEHFVDPCDTTHPKFANLEDLEIVCYSASDQIDGKPSRPIRLGEAVAAKLVANETLGYYLGRIHQFLIMIGIDPNRLRFRQHMSNEMAHYARDCWDAEIKTSHGWIECVGCADRSCFDLQQHSKAANDRLFAEKNLPAPRTVDVLEVIPQKTELKKVFKEETREILELLASLSEERIAAMEADLTEGTTHRITYASGTQVGITKDMVHFQRRSKVVHVERIVPEVIEPSFGIGRILYALLEHSFKTREADEQRNFFSLSPIVAPLKCAVLPLSRKAEFMPIVNKLSAELTGCDVSHKVADGAGSIGNRYVRTDELGIPFGITVDFDSLVEPHTATLRERDSMAQVRCPVDDIPPLIRDLSLGKITWGKDVQPKYPRFEQQEATKASQDAK